MKPLSAPAVPRPRLGKAGLLCLFVGAACCVAGPGCVQRRMTIRSNPTGAMVYIDNQEIGTTPVSTNFTYYRTREFRLVKDGYEPLTEKRTLPVPWYQFVPLDFVTENLVPGEIRDHRTLDFQLVPQRVVPTEELLDRAEGLRRQTQGSGALQARPAPRPARAYPAGGGTLPAATNPWESTPPAGASVPSSSSNDVLPYPTEPPGGWQPRS